MHAKKNGLKEKDADVKYREIADSDCDDRCKWVSPLQGEEDKYHGPRGKEYNPHADEFRYTPPDSDISCDGPVSCCVARVLCSSS